MVADDLLGQRARDQNQDAWQPATEQPLAAGERAQYIMDSVEVMVSNLMYYDRKEDEQLPVGAIEEAIEQGEITVDQIVDKVRTLLS